MAEFKVAGRQTKATGVARQPLSLRGAKRPRAKPGVASLLTKYPSRFSRHFHRHGRACPGHRSWQSAATDGRHKPGHDGEAGFAQGGSADGRMNPQ